MAAYLACLPTWDKPITLKNNISIEEIYDTVSKHS